MGMEMGKYKAELSCETIDLKGEDILVFLSAHLRSRISWLQA